MHHKIEKGMIDCCSSSAMLCLRGICYFVIQENSLVAK